MPEVAFNPAWFVASVRDGEANEECGGLHARACVRMVEDETRGAVAPRMGRRWGRIGQLGG